MLINHTATCAIWFCATVSHHTDVENSSEIKRPINITSFCALKLNTPSNPLCVTRARILNRIHLRKVIQLVK